MNKILPLLFIILLQNVAKADYKYMPLSSLVCMADYAAIGKIVDLDDSYFYLKVDKYVLNELELDTLKIQKTEDWLCGWRHEKYSIGQKELVFFRKSNYIIKDYDLLGYGAGGEFELSIIGDTIFYHKSIGYMQPYLLKDFITALKDYDEVKRKAIESKTEVSTSIQNTFSEKSELHKLFIECKLRKKREHFELPQNGVVFNLERNYLYQDYDNKVFIPNHDMNDIFLEVDNAEVKKQDGYFIMNPKDAWTRRFIRVYAIKDKNKEQALFSQIFEILELPEPRIYFGDQYRDTIYSTRDAKPSVAHYLDQLHEDRYLKYKLLSYTYSIKSKGTTKSFDIKSTRGTIELKEQFRKLEIDDEVSISNVLVLFPNNTVHQIEGRTVVYAKWIEK